MGNVIRNPRRVPRAPAACEARCLLPGGGFWASDTTDVSPGGIQLQAPGPFKAGDPLKLTLRSDRVEGFLADSGRWFDRLVAAYPGLATFQHAPLELELAATLFLGPPPRIPPALGQDEVRVLRAVGLGATVGKLKDQYPDDWPALEGALFGMLGKRFLTLDPGAASSLAAWEPHLAAHAS